MQPAYQPTSSLQLSSLIYKTTISGLYFIKHQPKVDDRGFFTELSIISQLETIFNDPFSIKQVNLAHSKKNVIRGFHRENFNKLVFVLTGEIFTVLLDSRPDSPTFSKYEIFQLGTGAKSLNGGLFISKGIANSVCVVTDPVNYIYLVDQVYKDRDTTYDQPINLFDPDLNITWPIPKENMIISDRDRNGVTLRSLFPEKFS